MKSGRNSIHCLLKRHEHLPSVLVSSVALANVEVDWKHEIQLANLLGFQSSASGAAGMFANLHSHKRGSQDYDTRRQNWAEMNEPKGAIAKAFENMIKK
jgi:hypothetical protein